MKSGHIGVFIRKGVRRLPLKELFGPDVLKLFSNPFMKQKLSAYVADRLPIVLRQELSFLFGKAKG